VQVDHQWVTPRLVAVVVWRGVDDEAVLWLFEGLKIVTVVVVAPAGAQRTSRISTAIELMRKLIVPQNVPTSPLFRIFRPIRGCDAIFLCFFLLNKHLRQEFSTPIRSSNYPYMKVVV
jgi:hypothetical protein